MKVSPNMKNTLVKVLSNSKVYLDVTIVEYIHIRLNFNIK